MTTAARRGRKPASIRTLWAIAKSPELAMTEDELHALVYRETKKESIRQLSQGELNTVVRVLQNMKDGVKRDTRSKRTDEGGDVRTVAQRRKIYVLTERLGWNDDNRINGLAKKMFRVDRIEWLEALKKMVARMEEQEAQRDE